MSKLGTKYEDVVAEAIRQRPDFANATITTRARVAVPGTTYPYEIDILIDEVRGGVARLRWAVECKDWNKPVGREEIERVRTRLDQITGHKGVVAASSGFTRAAEELAAKKGITLWHITKEGELKPIVLAAAPVQVARRTAVALALLSLGAVTVGGYVWYSARAKAVSVASADLERSLAPPTQEPAIPPRATDTTALVPPPAATPSPAVPGNAAVQGDPATKAGAESVTVAVQFGPSLLDANSVDTRVITHFASLRLVDCFLEGLDRTPRRPATAASKLGATSNESSSDAIPTEAFFPGAPIEGFQQWVTLPKPPPQGAALVVIAELQPRAVPKRPPHLIEERNPPGDAPRPPQPQADPPAQPVRLTFRVPLAGLESSPTTGVRGTATDPASPTVSLMFLLGQ